MGDETGLIGREEIEKGGKGIVFGIFKAEKGIGLSRTLLQKLVSNKHDLRIPIMMMS